MLRCHCILDRLELRGKEFDDAAALGTDHVIVVLVLIVVLVVRNAVAKSNLTGQAGFGQEFQGPVDGGLPYAWVFLLDKAVQVLAGKMCFRAQEDVENQVALRRALEALSLDMFEENFLLFGHVRDQLNSFAQNSNTRALASEDCVDEVQESK